MNYQSDSPIDDALGAALRRDAETWRPGPHRDATVEFLAKTASHRARRIAPWHVVAASMFAAVVWWGVVPDAPESDRSREPRGRVADLLAPATEVVFAPLEAELVAVTEDVSAFAGVVWSGVPSRVRRLLSESE